MRTESIIETTACLKLGLVPKHVMESVGAPVEHASPPFRGKGESQSLVLGIRPVLRLQAPGVQGPQRPSTKNILKKT